MLRHSGTTSINPAFLQEIKDDSVHLRELLDATHRALARGSSEQIRPRALSDLLGQVRDQLATHFILEEFYGYFDEALDAAPRLVGRASALRRQHEVLFDKISELAADSQRIAEDLTDAAAIRSLVYRYDAFHHELAAHEMDEHQLIMESLYDDVGTGD